MDRKRGRYKQNIITQRQNYPFSGFKSGFGSRHGDCPEVVFFTGAAGSICWTTLFYFSTRIIVLSIHQRNLISDTLVIKPSIIRIQTHYVLFSECQSCWLISVLHGFRLFIVSQMHVTSMTWKRSMFFDSRVSCPFITEQPPFVFWGRICSFTCGMWTCFLCAEGVVVASCFTLSWRCEPHAKMWSGTSEKQSKGTKFSCLASYQRPEIVVAPAWLATTTAKLVVEWRSFWY